MTDQAKASLLASQALEYWTAGQPELAIPLYEEALTLADPDFYSLPDYHGAYAGALASVGRFDEAGKQRLAALAAEQRQNNDDFSPGVTVARYFLAEHLLQQNQPAAALDAIEPSLKAGVDLESPLRYAKALALHSLGRLDEARHEAALALATAPSEEKRLGYSALLDDGLGKVLNE